MTAYEGPLDGERLTPESADALVNAFPGMMIYADPIAESLSSGGIAWGDPDAELVTAETMERQHARPARWTGVRDPLDEHHPVAVKLRAALNRAPDAIPEPEAAIVGELEALGCVRVDRVLSCRGVPIPAGAEQTAYFVVLRHRALFSPLADPARLYRGDLAYNAAHVTDELQESILLVSTRIHHDHLVTLQRTAPALFVSIWMRELEAAEQLVATTPVSALPPCYPRIRLDDPRKCLLIACDLMAEHERGVDLLEALRFHGGVTRTTMKAALKACTRMTDVYAVADHTHRHLAAGIAHLRSVHPTMDGKAPKRGVDPMYEVIKTGFEQNRVYGKQHRRVTWVMGDMPTRFFLGVEPAMLIPVMLIQMREMLVRHEKSFWLGARGRQDPCSDNLATRTMSLAIIITSTICVPTARAMMHDDGLLRDTSWLCRDVAPLVRNPRMRDKLVKLAKCRDEGKVHTPATTKVVWVPYAPGDRADFKSSYEGALLRARLCSSAIGEPGWTQGFRFDAWRQPLAEVDFLRDCCRYVQYNEKHVPLRDQWNKVASAAGAKGGRPITAADLPTGLPRQHLLERVQDLFRPQFDRVQVADLVRGAETSEAWKRREAFIREIAPMLPALSAITDDPHLNERFWIDRDSPAVRLATQGAWNC